ncbi:MAG: hypothetical protein JWO38_7602 [Gemmataceae bacterium]|nr:hypothetical protein [Gemmataceae bacterium]
MQLHANQCSVPGAERPHAPVGRRSPLADEHRLLLHRRAGVEVCLHRLPCGERKGNGSLLAALAEPEHHGPGTLCDQQVFKVNSHEVADPTSDAADRRANSAFNGFPQLTVTHPSGTRCPTGLPLASGEDFDARRGPWVVKHRPSCPSLTTTVRRTSPPWLQERSDLSDTSPRTDQNPGSNPSDLHASVHVAVSPQQDESATEWQFGQPSRQVPERFSREAAKRRASRGRTGPQGDAQTLVNPVESPPGGAR